MGWALPLSGAVQVPVICVGEVACSIQRPLMRLSPLGPGTVSSSLKSPVFHAWAMAWGLSLGSIAPWGGIRASDVPAVAQVVVLRLAVVSQTNHHRGLADGSFPGACGLILGMCGDSQPSRAKDPSQRCDALR
jgi:hypothetical protein